MSNQFEGVFELFYFQPRKQVNGDKLQIVFEKPFVENDPEWDGMSKLFTKDVQVKVQQNVPEGEKKTVITVIDDIFHVTMVKLRGLANGNRKRIVIEKLCDVDNLRRCADLWNHECDVFMEVIQRELSLKKLRTGNRKNR